MKTLLRLSVFLLAAVIARADLVIEQKIESQFLNGNSTVKIKGEQARMDMPSPIGGNVTVLMDLKSGQMTTLIHAQKMAMKMNMAEAKKAAEEQQKKTGVDLTKIEAPKASGQKEKIGEWNCDIYEVNMGGMTGKMWVTKEFPNYKAIMDQMNKINSAASAGMGIDPSKFQLDGMTVKTEMSTPVGKMTTTLIKATEVAVPDSEFAMPAGYNEVKMPSLPGK
jgi:hypothetical protein